MKVIQASVWSLVLVASSAFAGIGQLQGDYVSGGTWKSASGQSGTWTSTVHVAKAERGYAVQEKLSVFAPGAKPDAAPVYTESSDWRAVGTTNGFFDVYEGQDKTGWGFCNQISCVVEGSKKAEGSTYGETYVFGKQGVAYRTGWDKSDKETIAWEGGMKKAGK